MKPTIFNKDRPLRIISLFSGIGAFEKALKRLEVPTKIIRYCDVDKWASKAYSLIHQVPETLNLGDIQQVDLHAIPDCDLLTWGFPCTNLSIAGLQEGLQYECQTCQMSFSFEKMGDTYVCPFCRSSAIRSVNQSGLYMEGLKFLLAKKPMYSIIENVKALTFKKNQKILNKILQDLDNAGYRNYYQVLNAKHYGIPQNRERIFIVSIRKDIEQDFSFPEPFHNGLLLKDFLETDVDEKYYLTGNYLAWWIRNKEFQLKKKYSSLDADIANCLTARMYASWNGNFISKLDKRTTSIYESLSIEEVLNGKEDAAMLTERRTEEAKKIRREYKEKYGKDYTPRRAKELVPRKDGMSNCLTATPSREHLVLEQKKQRIRQLTPAECFRLMGFDAEDCHICQQAGILDSHLYKMAGNSIVVNVLEEIFKVLLFQIEKTTISHSARQN